MTPSGIEPAVFRFVAQHLHNCAPAVPTTTTNFSSFPWCPFRRRVASARSGTISCPSPVQSPPARSSHFPRHLPHTLYPFYPWPSFSPRPSSRFHTCRGFLLLPILVVGRDSSVGTATRNRVDVPWVEFRWGGIFRTRQDRPPRPIQPPA